MWNKLTAFVFMLILVVCSTAMARAQEAQATNVLLDYLYSDAGPKFNCYFVLEDDFDDKGHRMLIGSTIKVPKDVSTLEELVTGLKSQLPGYAILVNPDKKIITIVNQNLESDPDYIMHRKVSIDADTNPELLVQQLSKICGGRLAIPTLFPIRPSIEMDLTTKVSVHAKNRSVRDVLEDYIPLAGYSHVIFRTVAATRNAEQVTEVFWQGTGYVSK